MLDIVFFDLETTGTSTVFDRIVEMSAIKIDSSLKVVANKLIIVNPTVQIPAEATKVHGISNEIVKEKPTFEQYSKSIYDFFKGCILGGYNILQFDIPLLIEEFARCGISYFPDNGAIDCFHIFREKEPRDLTAALKFYCDKIMEDAHKSENDNLATIDVMIGQMQKYNMSLNDVIEFFKPNPNFVDMAGKIILIDGIPCYNIGKAKGVPVKNDFGFGQWMLRNEFSTNTKNVIKSILNIK